MSWAEAKYVIDNVNINCDAIKDKLENIKTITDNLGIFQNYSQGPMVGVSIHPIDGGCKICIPSFNLVTWGTYEGTTTRFPVSTVTKVRVAATTGLAPQHHDLVDDCIWQDLEIPPYSPDLKHAKDAWLTFKGLKNGSSYHISIFPCNSSGFWGPAQPESLSCNPPYGVYGVKIDETAFQSVTYTMDATNYLPLSPLGNGGSWYNDNWKMRLFELNKIVFNTNVNPDYVSTTGTSGGSTTTGMGEAAYMPAFYAGYDSQSSTHYFTMNPTGHSLCPNRIPESPYKGFLMPRYYPDSSGCSVAYSSSSTNGYNKDQKNSIYGTNRFMSGRMRYLSARYLGLMIGLMMLLTKSTDHSIWGSGPYLYAQSIGGNIPNMYRNSLNEGGLTGEVPGFKGASYATFSCQLAFNSVVLTSHRSWIQDSYLMIRNGNLYESITGTPFVTTNLLSYGYSSGINSNVSIGKAMVDYSSYGILPNLKLGTVANDYQGYKASIQSYEFINGNTDPGWMYIHRLGDTGGGKESNYDNYNLLGLLPRVENYGTAIPIVLTNYEPIV